MRIAIAELLASTYNLEYLLRLTILKYTHIFIVDFHGKIYQNERKNHVFHRDILRVYEQVVFLSRLQNRQVWSCPGIPAFPPLTLPKAEVPPPLKLHIVWMVRNIELWPIPCVMKYWRLDLSFINKKKKSSLHAALYDKNHSVQCPPPPPPPTPIPSLYQSLKSYQSFHDPQSEVRQRF